MSFHGLDVRLFCFYSILIKSLVRLNFLVFYTLVSDFSFKANRLSGPLREHFIRPILCVVIDSLLFQFRGPWPSLQTLSCVYECKINRAGVELQIFMYVLKHTFNTCLNIHTNHSGNKENPRRQLQALATRTKD